VQHVDSMPAKQWRSTACQVLFAQQKCSLSDMQAACMTSGMDMMRALMCHADGDDSRSPVVCTTEMQARWLQWCQCVLLREKRSNKDCAVSTIRRHASRQLRHKHDCNDSPKQTVCSNTLPIWEGQWQPSLRSLRRAITNALTSGSCCKHWLAIQSNASGHGAVVRQPVFNPQCSI